MLLIQPPGYHNPINVVVVVVVVVKQCTFVSDQGYLAAYSNACGSKLSDVLNDTKFCTFLNLCEN